MDIFGCFIADWLIYATFILVGLYFLTTRRHGELAKLGIPHPKPLPFLGNMIYLMKNFREVDIRLMNEYGKICGLYEGNLPTITIGNVNILRNILIKDFQNFSDRRPLAMRGYLRYGVLDVREARWKEMRNQLSPAFSSGKLKMMSQIMSGCIATLDQHISTTIERKNGIFEAKEFCQTFTLDVIATVGFGIQLDTQTDSSNLFNKMAMKYFNVPVYSPSILLFLFFPGFAAFLDKLTGYNLFNTFDKEAHDFFVKLLSKTIEERKQSPTNHKDFVNLLLALEKETENTDKDAKGLTHEEMIGNALVFFVAGFETTATTFCFLLYFLATNPQVQNKMLEEISEQTGDKIEAKYEDTMHMTYMDMAINETLRMISPLPRVDRLALNDVEYEGLRIPAGFLVTTPIMALHMDPHVWPEPEKFDPERFSTEQKAKRDPMYFLPFGQGPRNCIGMRLALVELKMALARVLQKYRFVPCDRTPSSLKYDKSQFLPVAKGGLWIKAERR